MSDDVSWIMKVETVSLAAYRLFGAIRRVEKVGPWKDWHWARMSELVIAVNQTSKATWTASTLGYIFHTLNNSREFWYFIQGEEYAVSVDCTVGDAAITTFEKEGLLVPHPWAKNTLSLCRQGVESIRWCDKKAYGLFRDSRMELVSRLLKRSS